jgi:hypothetical protein
MQPVTVLVMEESAYESVLMRAALARCLDVRVVESLSERAASIVLAIAGPAALRERSDELKGLEARGIPVIGIATGLSSAVKQKALDAGVREIHDRPEDWRPYAELIEGVVGRFIRTG